MRSARAPARGSHSTQKNRAKNRVDPLGNGCFTSRPLALSQRDRMRHTISVLVENKFGVLTRVAGLFTGRAYTIDTLNVGPTEDPHTSRMTIVTRSDDPPLEPT